METDGTYKSATPLVDGAFTDKNQFPFIVALIYRKTNVSGKKRMLSFKSYYNLYMYLCSHSFLRWDSSNKQTRNNCYTLLGGKAGREDGGVAE